MNKKKKSLFLCHKITNMLVTQTQLFCVILKRPFLTIYTPKEDCRTYIKQSIINNTKQSIMILHLHLCRQRLEYADFIPSGGGKAAPTKNKQTKTECTGYYTSDVEAPVLDIWGV